jgi:DNA-binding transcriptional MerR regulator
MDAPAQQAGQELFTINQLAEELGVTQRALRFYEAKGLIAPRRVGTMRVFTRRDRARLRLVLRGIRLGFSLAEVREYLDLYDADPTQREQVRLLLGKVAARIEALEAQRRDLEQALAELRGIEAQARAALGGDADGRAAEAPAKKTTRARTRQA